MSTLFVLAACIATAPRPGSSHPVSSTTEASSPATETTPETGTTGSTPTRWAAPENVLIVLLDDVGADSLDLDGLASNPPPTPTIDGLAADGEVFHNAWSMPLCSPTRAALLTGRYPHRNGIGTVIEFSKPKDPLFLANREVTLPEMLATAATPWDSSLVGKWHVSASGDQPQPRDQGFGWAAGPLGNIEFNDDYFTWHETRNDKYVRRSGYITSHQADDAVEPRIGAMQEPWLLYLALTAPHDPYSAPPEDLVPGRFRTLEEKYGAMITAADLELGRVLASMDPEVRDRTTIVVMGDNGTPGDFDQPDHDRMKGMPYQGGIHVPLVIAGPRVGNPGSETDALVDVVDLFPTVAAIAGVEVGSAKRPIDGVSLLPVLADPTARIHDTVYSELFMDDSETWTLRDERYKLVYCDDWSWFISSCDGTELFDLLADPGETTDLSTSSDPDAQAALERLTAEASALREDMGVKPD